jgi:hypothetical protein
MTNLSEEISDEMTGRRRLAAMRKLTENLPTENIELINERFPKLTDWALHQILNPEPESIWDVSELRRMLGVKEEAAPQCLAHWMPEPCLFCENESEAAS